MLLLCTRNILQIMKVFEKNADLQNALFAARKQGQSVGFVPTMGALHEGHASLIKRSAKENDVTVVSVFLNPTQFNDPADLERYPRTLKADCALCEACGADFVFAPTVSDIYPTPDTRLFYIVQPTRAYFGEKDWQQIAVIRRLVAYIGSHVEIVPCPVVREADGVALSSRNKLLTPEERAIAPHIARALMESIDYAKTHTVAETHDHVVSTINAIDGLEVEYFQIVDGNTLLDVQDWQDSDYVVGCITVYCGKTPIRLIDHIKYKE